MNFSIYYLNKRFGTIIELNFLILHCISIIKQQLFPIFAARSILQINNYLFQFTIHIIRLRSNLKTKWKN